MAKQWKWLHDKGLSIKKKQRFDEEETQEEIKELLSVQTLEDEEDYEMESEGTTESEDF